MPTTKKKPTATKAKSPKATKSAPKPTKKTPAPKATARKTASAKSGSTKSVSKSTPKSTKPKITAAKKSTAKKSTALPAKKTNSKVSSSKIAASKVSNNAEPHALDDEVTEKVRELIHLSSEQGFLTYKDVDKALPKIADKPEELQNVISIFNNLEIKLMDSKDVEKFKKNKEESEEETAKSNQSDMLDDPVRMYLKQMGKVPLLSREEEVDISKRIESAETAALKIIYSVSLTNDFQLDICKKLLEREERFDRVVLDKKIDSREAYFRSLNKQVIALEDLNQKIKKAWISIESASNATQRKRSTTRFQKIRERIGPDFQEMLP